MARVDINGSLDITFEEWRHYLMFHPSSDISDIIEHWRDDAYIPDHGGDVAAVPGILWDNNNNFILNNKTIS